MAALNFKEQFKPLILSGEKRQTIRACRKRPIQKGEKLYLYVNQRTKRSECLGVTVCKAVEPITIKRLSVTGRPVIKIGDQVLTVEMNNLFALKDGFKSFAEFWRFFFPSPADEYLGFTGHVIRWEKLGINADDGAIAS